MPIKFDTTNRTPLTEGGEGAIYEYNGKIVKVFKPHIDLSTKERKVNALVKLALPKAVVKPIDSVTDSRGRFIGYYMDKVTGEEFKRLSNKKFVTANNIDTKFVLSLLVKVQSVLDEVHRKNIYVGDLNDQNILFDMSGNIYLIDCDSWTVGNDKCSVAMDLFKDPKLKADNFNADTDNYAFSVLAWKCLTRIHPFGGTMKPDMAILERMKKGISVIDRKEVTLPRTVKSWNGFSPDLLNEFKAVFEKGQRNLSGGLEDMLNNLSYCKKDNEYYYSKFSSCPYCDSTAQVNKKPISQGTVGGLKLYALYDGENIKTVFDRYTYLDNGGLVRNGNRKMSYDTHFRYYFLESGVTVLEESKYFSFITDKPYTIDKKFKSSIEVEGNSIYFISPQNTLVKMEVMPSGNAMKNICKVSNAAYFAVSNGNYCILNYYAGKIIVNVNGANAVIDYNGDIANYGIRRDDVTGKWLILLEDTAGKFYTYVLKENEVEYRTDAIKYDCQLNFPCINNSTIFIPIDGKIRGYNYKKSVLKDFECGAVSEESKLIKEKNKFVIVNFENVYVLG